MAILARPQPPQQKAGAFTAHRAGPKLLGERNGHHRLDRDQVIKVRKLIRAQVTREDIGKRFGVTASCIDAIATRRTWGWLADPDAPDPGLVQPGVVVVDSDPPQKGG